MARQRELSNSVGPPPDRVTRFINGLLADLRVPLAGEKFARPVHCRRYKAATVRGRCGAGKMNAAVLGRLSDRLRDERVYTDRSLTDLGLCADDWIRFARLPFADPALAVPYEEVLRILLKEAIGKYGELRGLKWIQNEYQLPNGRRIDLLCEEVRRNGRGPLVAVELKRSTDEGTVHQMIEYLRELKRDPLSKGRDVRGIIVVGGDDRVGEEMAKAVDQCEIQWLRYRVTLEACA